MQWRRLHPCDNQVLDGHSHRLRRLRSAFLNLFCWVILMGLDIVPENKKSFRFEGSVCWVFAFIERKKYYQECIPVECVLTTAVSSARCQYSVHFLSGPMCSRSGLCPGGLCPAGALSRVETPRRGQTPVKTLPSLAVGKKNRFFFFTMRGTLHGD